METDELVIGDYEEAHSLWSRTEGMGLSAADERGPIERYLARNVGLSSAAREGGRLVGTLLAGHDGRRGYLHHLAVEQSHRRRGVGRELVARSLSLLAREGIDRCHIFIFATNEGGQGFWKAAGWEERVDLRIFSRGLADLG